MISMAGNTEKIVMRFWQRRGAGYDSVWARGSMEPNPALDATLTLGGHPVAVPQGDPVNLLDFTSFTQSEYLLYQESQAS